jgi:hypothetical protein
MLMLRRDFLALTACALLPRGARPIRIGITGDGGSATLGARLAAEEGARTALLLGRSVELVNDVTGADLSAVVLTRPADARSPVTLTAYAEPRCSDAFRIIPARDALVWDKSLEKFGAAQLNERFRRAWQADMDGQAWAGWFAVKAVVESALRTTDIRAHLLSPRTLFDGHKGVPLRFDAATRLLIQPLYRRAPSGLEELPPEKVPCSR